MSDSRPRTTTRPIPPTSGAPGIAQGAYGERGNLELVIPADGEGFWVFWFNGDDADQRTGAARRCWSGGLHIASGGRLEVVQIAQLDSGPGFLEVVGRSGATLQRWFWTPESGFLDGGRIGVAASADATAPIEAGGRLHALRLDSAGEVVHVVSDPASYPRLDWRTGDALLPGVRASAISLGSGSSSAGTPHATVIVDGCARPFRHTGAGWRAITPPPGRWRTATVMGMPSAAAIPGDPAAVLAVVGLSEDGVLRIEADAGGGWRSVLGPRGSARGSSVTACYSSLDGGTLEVVLRSGAELRHLRFATEGGSPELRSDAPLVSTVWQDEEGAIHRDAGTAPLAFP